MNQQAIIEALPVYLQPFAAVQDYSRYTPRDHAVWRFLLHQLRHNLAQTAHAVYIEGLYRTGISLEAIPQIEDINRCLGTLGWRAVVVDGFLPPAIFMAFQAHRVLPIAVDMRSMAHMLYTPAPDIVHESAGHVPFIVDVDYAEFLQRFGELGMRAIASKDDIAVYDAVRHLSIMKETLDASQQDIQQAEQALSAAVASNTAVSEAALLARLHWWTVEYGLVGELDNYRIFGAGLLSSLGESVTCLDDSRVNKLPLTVDAIATAYDITCEQPQLFVTKNCRHLSQVLEEFGRQMCVNRGGAESVNKAIAAQTVNTAVTNAGLEIAGCFVEALTDAIGNIVYIKTSGATQLAYQGQELLGHGIDYHSEGFGSPVGRLQTMERCLSSYTIDELKQQGIALGEQVTLAFLSGVTVVGKLDAILRREQKNILMGFSDCTVTGRCGEVLFAPEWGNYDMAVGDSIVSVYGGAADPHCYPLYLAPSAQPTPHREYSDHIVARFACYQRIRHLRESALTSQTELDLAQVRSLIDNVIALASADPVLNGVVDTAADTEWLLVFEVIELAQQYGLAVADYQHLHHHLLELCTLANADLQRLMTYGLERLGL